MAITATLLRAGVGFDTEGMSIGVYCQMEDDVVGDLGIRYHRIANTAVQQQVLQILTAALPLLEPELKVGVVLPNNTTLVVGPGPSPVTQPSGLGVSIILAEPTPPVANT